MGVGTQADSDSDLEGASAVDHPIPTEMKFHLPLEPNSALVEHARQRADSVQNRIADRITTFVMISQNRADAKRQVVADLQWQTVREEDMQNRELLHLSNQILNLTKETHARAKPPVPGG